MLPEFDARKESVKQAKVNAFRDIKNTAVERGAGWSGFLPSEEARYVGEEYLPALATLTGDQNRAQMSLKDALLNLQTDRRSQVLDFRERLRQEALERKQLQEQREFERQQNQLDRSYSGGGGGFTPTAGERETAALALAAEEFRPGSDNFVSPDNWNSIRNDWIKAGGSAGAFDAQYGHLINPAHFARKDLKDYSVSSSFKDSLAERFGGRLNYR